MFVASPLALGDLSEESTRRPAFAGEVLTIALPDVSANLRIAQLEVVLELVDVHDAGDGNAIFLEDEVLLVETNPLDHGAKVDARLRR